MNERFDYNYEQGKRRKPGIAVEDPHYAALQEYQHNQNPFYLISRERVPIEIAPGSPLHRAIDAIDNIALAVCSPRYLVGGSVGVELLRLHAGGDPSISLLTSENDVDIVAFRQTKHEREEMSERFRERIAGRGEGHVVFQGSGEIKNGFRHTNRGLRFIDDEEYFPDVDLLDQISIECPSDLLRADIRDMFQNLVSVGLHLPTGMQELFDIARTIPIRGMKHSTGVFDSEKDYVPVLVQVLPPSLQQVLKSVRNTPQDRQHLAALRDVGLLPRVTNTPFPDDGELLTAGQATEANFISNYRHSIVRLRFSPAYHEKQARGELPEGLESQVRAAGANPQRIWSFLDLSQRTGVSYPLRIIRESEYAYIPTAREIETAPFFVEVCETDPRGPHHAAAMIAVHGYALRLAKEHGIGSRDPAVFHAGFGDGRPEFPHTLQVAYNTAAVVEAALTGSGLSPEERAREKYIAMIGPAGHDETQNGIVSDESMAIDRDIDSLLHALPGLTIRKKRRPADNGVNEEASAKEVATFMRYANWAFQREGKELLFSEEHIMAAVQSVIRTIPERMKTGPVLQHLANDVLSAGITFADLCNANGMLLPGIPLDIPGETENERTMRLAQATIWDGYALALLEEEVEIRDRMIALQSGATPDLFRDSRYAAILKQRRKNQIRLHEIRWESVQRQINALNLPEEAEERVRDLFPIREAVIAGVNQEYALVKEMSLEELSTHINKRLSTPSPFVLPEEMRFDGDPNECYPFIRI